MTLDVEKARIANAATEPEGHDEIEITPEMVAAGVDAFCHVLLDMDPYEEIVTDVYRAMEAMRRKTPSNV